jgi:hypothetical protein
MALAVMSYQKLKQNCHRREIALNKHASRHDMVASRRWNG